MLVLYPYLIGACFLLSYVFLRHHTRRNKKITMSWSSGFGLPPIFQFLIAFYGTKIGPHKKLKEYTDKFGKILASYQLFGNQVFYIDDPKMLRKALSEENFLDRGSMPPEFQKHMGGYGMMFTNGPVWTEQRKFALRTLREFGFGKKSMESLVHTELSYLNEGLAERAGKGGAATNDLIQTCVLNCLWTMMAGKRFSKADETIINTFHELSYLMGEFGKTPVSVLLPKSPSWTVWERLKRNANFAKEYFRREIDDHKETLRLDEPPRDFIDCHLLETLKTTDPKSSFYGEMGKKCLTSVLYELFFAGSDTTGITVYWSLLIMSQYPEIQRKFQAEIDQVVGKDRFPSLDDESKMPYTQAVIMEVLRKSSIAGLIAAHQARRPAKWEGLDIQKGDWIIQNIYSVHHAKESWGDPENFRPERFLTPDGKSIIKPLPEAYIPFSVGRRSCPGELFAKNILFLFITALFQSFSFAPDSKSGEDVTLEPRWAATLIPTKFYPLEITKRI